MTCTLFALFCCIMLTAVWSLSYRRNEELVLTFQMTPTAIEPKTTRNVTLTCQESTNHRYYRYDSFSRSNKPTFEVIRLRILKNYMKEWRTIAQISDTSPETVEILDHSISFARGSVRSDVSVVSLEIIWDVATLDAYGQYRCDAVAFPADKTKEVIETPYIDLAIGSDLNQLNILILVTHEFGKMTDIVEKYHSQQTQAIEDAKDISLNMTATQNELASQVDRLEQVVENQSKVIRERQNQLVLAIQTLREQHSKRIDELLSHIQLIIESSFLMLWPQGSYGLLMANTGCPKGGTVNWEKGWRRHHTESTDRNQDKVSEGHHLYGATLSRELGNNFITQHFCVKTEADTVGPTWPKGSYCINKKGRCPNSLQEGFIRWDEEHDDPAETFERELPDSDFNNSFTIFYYCCRQDGPSDDPIYLPNAQPFYLYRHGGQCQQVYGMNVTEEYLEFDTENSDNRDSWDQAHPDGNIDNVRLQLCYYQKY